MYTINMDDMFRSWRPSSSPYRA